MTEGYTYNLFTDCATTHGSPILRLLDLDGTEVAYNDGFPFCGNNITAALIEFFIPCDEYPLPINEYALSAECVLDTACSASLVIEEATKIPPEPCGRLPPPPPSPSSPPPAPPVASPPPRPPPGAQCSSFVPPTTSDAIPIVATPDNTFVYARTEDCPTSCGKHCEAGCFFCSDSGVLPGSVPDPAIPNTQFVAMSYSAEVDGCSAAFDDAGDQIYKTGSVISAPGLSACLNGFYRSSHVCATPAACGTWTLRD